ncbi:hypothetical protein [Chondromyces apiculatus]|uniref:Tryptophan synthase alpha chain n=1 Tax=Chondromyces apiculatus DSM 436 TaxID=1192034 RepID=A0A017SVG7_9BACT|nr:hypothetical protein [Chondromyces apiculatus]EYF00978.1 Hypothetical protein CAP_8846 [Chondromyces apiculatus DSM 436]
MKYFALFSSFALGLGVAAGACGDDGSNPGGDGGTTTSVGGAGGTGGASACPTSLDNACGTCMGEACCEDLSACEDDPDCWACVNAQDSEACERTQETHERVDRYLVCRGGSCQQACIEGGNGECEGDLAPVYEPACAACREGACCDEVANCAANEACWVDCFTQHDTDLCHANQDGHALYHALMSCFSSADCETECAVDPVDAACDAPADSPSMGACVPQNAACNPVTNAGCTEEGSACDIAPSGAFQCFPAPNTQAICEPCSQSVGYCAPGGTCVPGSTCARFCCDDGDCGTGTCDKTLLNSTDVGVCVAAN